MKTFIYFKQRKYMNAEKDTISCLEKMLFSETLNHRMNHEY